MSVGMYIEHDFDYCTKIFLPLPAQKERKYSHAHKEQ